MLSVWGRGKTLTLFRKMFCQLGNRMGIWTIKVLPQQFPRVDFWSRPKADRGCQVIDYLCEDLSPPYVVCPEAYCLCPVCSCIRPCVSRNIVNTMSCRVFDTFLPTYINDTLWDRDERIRVWGSAGQGYGRIKYVGNSTFWAY